jgi:dolichol-phosphate mannosyltransferase
LLNTAFADDPQVRLISHEAPRGLGQALCTGFSLATGDIVITTDFDHAYNLNTIPQILAHLLVYEADVVTASPYHPKGGIEGLRGYQRIFRPGINSIYRLLIKRDVYTWTALFRAYRREVLDSITFESHGALANTELLVNAIRSGYKVSEYPIKASSASAGRSGKHRLSPLKDHLRYQLKLLFSPRKDPQQQASLTHRRT